MKTLLWAGVAAPIIYLATQVAGIALNPSFNIAAQQPSELGMANENLPIVANAGFIASGLGFMLGGLGLFGGLRGIDGNIVLAAIAGFALSVLGFCFVMSGLFPLPNPLHYAFGLYPVGLFAPLFAALGYKNGGPARWVAAIGFVACLGIFLATGFDHLANDNNAALFSRAISIVLFAAVAYVCWSLMRRLKTAG